MKCNPKFKPFTKKVRITKARNYEIFNWEAISPYFQKKSFLSVRQIGTSVSVTRAFGPTVLAAFADWHKLYSIHLCSKAGTACRHREISKVLAEKLRDLIGPAEL